MAWTSLTFAYGSILTSTKMTQMYDNFQAVADGDSGAPNIQTAGIAANAVTSAKIATGAVGHDELSTNPSASSTTITNVDTFVPTAGWYQFTMESTYGAGGVEFEINVSGAWRNMSSNGAGAASKSMGLVFCDGTNMRFQGLQTGTHTIYWQRVA